MAPLLLSRRNGIYLCVYPVYTVDATIGKTSKEHAHNSSPLLCLGREQKLLRPLWRRSCCCWLVQLKQPDRRQLDINRGQSHSSFFFYISTFFFLSKCSIEIHLLCTASSNFDCALDFDFGFSSKSSLVVDLDQQVSSFLFSPSLWSMIGGGHHLRTSQVQRPFSSSLIFRFARWEWLWMTLEGPPSKCYWTCCFFLS